MTPQLSLDSCGTFWDSRDIQSPGPEPGPTRTSIHERAAQSVLFMEEASLPGKVVSFLSGEVCKQVLNGPWLALF